ncbi:hypothetical protein [Croceibacter atlanticus]|jgi:hypothetical protein|uniref:gp33 family protein n=1 Tax=Croceibacter atlanticus TaxID=313588 RepID=UPI0030DD8ED9|tara:strand:- start:6981 stop:7556 length:576 start_codon:yes stop_codon:yes gene_type:complete
MNNEIWKEVEADADKFKDLSTEGGKDLSDLIRQATNLNKQIDVLEEELKTLKQKKQSYMFDLIPAKMGEMGMDKVEVNGNAVSLSTFVSATMPKDPIQREQAMSHLRDIGASDFIKNQVMVNFGINEDNMARSVQSELDDKGMDTTARVWVEPSTLKKLVRERVENNQKIDLELFKAHVGQVAKIKGGKDE